MRGDDAQNGLDTSEEEGNNHLQVSRDSHLDQAYSKEELEETDHDHQHSQKRTFAIIEKNDCA